MHILSPVTDNCPPLIGGRRNESLSLDRVSNPTPLAFESDALPTALRGPAKTLSLFYQVVRRFCQMQIVTFIDNEFAGLQKLFMFLNRYRVVLNK